MPLPQTCAKVDRADGACFRRWLDRMLPLQFAIDVKGTQVPIRDHRHVIPTSLYHWLRTGDRDSGVQPGITFENDVAVLRYVDKSAWRRRRRRGFQNRHL